MYTFIKELIQIHVWKYRNDVEHLNIISHNEVNSVSGF